MYTNQSDVVVVVLNPRTVSMLDQASVVDAAFFDGAAFFEFVELRDHDGNNIVKPVALLDSVGGDHFRLRVRLATLNSCSLYAHEDHFAKSTKDFFEHLALLPARCARSVCDHVCGELFIDSLVKIVVDRKL